MANVLNIENLTKSYGDRLLFGDITFGVEQGDKIGIVARNGTGKTTLLRIIAGVEDADSGKVTFRSDMRIGYLPQEPQFNGSTVYEAALDNACDPRAAAVLEYRNALLSDDEVCTHEAYNKMDKLGAWDYEDRLRQLLTRLGFTDLDAQVDKLSGGQRKRLAITRLVMAEPDFPILDEPTNHLDISTIEWLEAYLKRSKATLMMVTHDRYFLDRVCSKILELDDCEAFMVEGNFDMYLRRRAERIEAMATELARVRNTLRREQEWMSRQPQARAGKAKFRIDNFYDLKERASRRHVEKRCKAREWLVAHRLKDFRGRRRVQTLWRQGYTRRFYIYICARREAWYSGRERCWQINLYQAVARNYTARLRGVGISARRCDSVITVGTEYSLTAIKRW